eukprot:TRINITY_DN51493_c0_g1_i1.p1 TRINITY_DN51493_c0_g1~~TRINITY_DN51493_c0_g1_i1.p1  ORF type:complete len:633 (-),score=169.19 TRINITY_DN51493_c0_g1_i1:27-1658(-)
MEGGLYVYRRMLNYLQKFITVQSKNANDCMREMDSLNQNILKLEREKYEQVHRLHARFGNLMYDIAEAQLMFCDRMEKDILQPLGEVYQACDEESKYIGARVDKLQSELSTAEDKINRGREEIYRLWDDFSNASPARCEKTLVTGDKKKILKMATQLTTQRERIRTECIKLESFVAWKQYYWNVDVPDILSDIEKVERRKIRGLSDCTSKIEDIVTNFCHRLEARSKKFTRISKFNGDQCLEDFVARELAIWGPPPQYFAIPNIGLVCTSRSMEQRSKEEELMYAQSDADVGRMHTGSKDQTEELVEKIKDHFVFCVKAIADFRSPTPGGGYLDIRSGDVVRVTSTDRENFEEFDQSQWLLGYLIGRKRGFEGWFPKSHVIKLEIKHRMDLAHLIEIPVGVIFFEKFLKREFSDENIYFWLVASLFEYESVGKSQEVLRKEALEIIKTFIGESSPKQVNLRGASCASLLKFGEEEQKRIANGDPLPPEYLDVTMFNPAAEEIFNVMEKDSFLRFKQSDLFTEFLTVTGSFENKEKTQFEIKKQ